jgi:exopolysaccharide biosynthesis polyprenyl glycosylphosphotransferase
MKTRDTFDFLTGLLAVVCDAAAIYAGFMFAFWIRFHSGWIPVFKGVPPSQLYLYAAMLATVLFLFIFTALGLYRRPQFGHFTEKIPRIIRAVGMGILLAMVFAYIFRKETEYSRIATALAFMTVSLLVIVERNILFQLERHWAKYQVHKKRVLVIGTGHMADRMRHTLAREHRLRAKLEGFLLLEEEETDPAIPQDLILGPFSELAQHLAGQNIDEVILTNPSCLRHEDMVQLIVQCEQNLAHFQMVPDIFRVLTSKVDMQNINGIPLLGVGKWPLDHFHHRVLKRSEDILGSLFGLLICAPIILVSGLIVKLSSPGPMFYRQVRCGEHGHEFTICKLRTMRIDAEDSSGPVWTEENDPRRTRFGSFLRSWNLDELPQFWNVLTGDMSLVGPRPERPHFVDQFKEDIDQYMWRHVSKPGITGWAQVNGLRGNTSLQERIKYDLFYLENWSLGLDFKILLKTLFSRTNAY